MFTNTCTFCLFERLIPTEVYEVAYCNNPWATWRQRIIIAAKLHHLFVSSIFPFVSWSSQVFIYHGVESTTLKKPIEYTHVASRQLRRRAWAERWATYVVWRTYCKIPTRSRILTVEQTPDSCTVVYKWLLGCMRIHQFAYARSILRGSCERTSARVPDRLANGLESILTRYGELLHSCTYTVSSQLNTTSHSLRLFGTQWCKGRS